MPPQAIFDLTGIDLDHVLFPVEHIREYNAQRGDMEHLTAISWVRPETGSLAAFKDVREDEFWVPGHIPGRPLLPGVIMIEAAAQLCAFYTRKYMQWTGFMGFGGLEDCKFRAQVSPGQRLHVLAQKMWDRHRRIGSKVQGWVKGTLAFEATIIGVQM